MRTAKFIAVIGLLAMSSVLIYGFIFGNFAIDGAEILRNPWGIVSLVDLYTGFLLFSVWIVYREKSIIGTIIWIVLIMILGFFTASLYTLIALINSDGDWKIFWMGKRANG